MPYTGDDMYRNILKEIGAGESNMDYLFDDDDNDDDDDDDDYDDRGGDEEIIVQQDNNDHSIHKGVVAVQQLRYDDQPQHQSSKGFDSSSDEELLNQWETEGEGNDDDDDDDMLETSQEEGGEYATTNTSSTNNRENREPAWKKMLQAATAEQEQLMGQMINLQKAQTESSPRNTATTNTSRIQESGQAEKENPESSVKVNDDDLNLSTVSSSTPLIQKLSSRNTKLQNEWQSQQVENVKLQDKMNAIQAKVYDQQKQWEQDQDDLFSPTRSKTKIPRWTGSSAGGGGDGGTAVAAMTPTTLSSKMHKTTDWVSPTNKSLQQQELLESNDKMRNLQAQLEESKKVQQSQKDELDDYKNRLQKRDLQHHDLLFQYETGKKSWQDSTEEINSKHESEIRSCQNDIEDARDKLHQQINVNQDLREENQKLKSSTNLLKDEFHCYTKELEGLHEEELEAWKSKVNDQDQHIEMEISNNTDLKTQLEEAHARCVHLKRRHHTEVKEWKLLLDADMNKKALNESATRNMIGGAGLEILSPIRNASSTRQQQNIYGDNSGDSHSSAVSVESAPSESMGKIDELMDELEEMDLERTAILNEINCNDNIQAESEDSPSAFPSAAAATMILTDAKSTESKEEKLQCLLDNTDGYFIDADDEDPPKPIESPANSVNGNGEETNASNTMSDSVVLDETLTLLNNLKNMMTCQGEGNEYETDVLERLEVLSELMQDQSGYQSLLSSVLHQDISGKQHDDDASGGEGSFEISTSNANNTSWISTLKAAAEENPWPALVAELRSRCEFLERDRDEVTRITDKIIEMERSSHKVELDAAVATTERKANENLHQVQLEANREMNSIYRNICLQCQKKVYM